MGDSVTTGASIAGPPTARYEIPLLRPLRNFLHFLSDPEVTPLPPPPPLLLPAPASATATAPELASGTHGTFTRREPHHSGAALVRRVRRKHKTVGEGEGEGEGGWSGGSTDINVISL